MCLLKLYVFVDGAVKRHRGDSAVRGSPRGRIHIDIVSVSIRDKMILWSRRHVICETTNQSRRCCKQLTKYLVPEAIVFITMAVFWKYLHVQVITPSLELNFIPAMLSVCGLAQKCSQGMHA